jgi:hypothetical protein
MNKSWRLSLAVTLLLITSISTVHGRSRQNPAAPEERSNPAESKAGLASVPPLIAFNGMLTDRDGRPLSGVAGVTFALYRDQRGGAPIWTENQNVQFDAQGRYTVWLGVTQPGGLPNDLFSSGEPRWLGIQSQVPGEEEQPRVFLFSVPYALKAADADTIGGKPASAFVLKELPADSAETPLSEDTPGTISPRTMSFPVTAGQSIDDRGVNPSLSITPSNYFGLGTTTPMSKLHMVDTNGQFFVDGSTATGGSLSLVMGNTTTGGRQFSFRNLNTGRFDIRDDSAGGGERFSINSAGNIGIGTVNPVSRFHVKDTNGQFWVDGSTAAGGSLAFVLANTVSGGRQFSFRNLNSGRFDIRDDSAGGGERISITSAGNIGIGTTNPGAKLDVAGNVHLTGTLTADSMTFGDITGVAAGAGLMGGGTTGDATLSQTPAALTRGITYLGGCDTCSVLTNADDQKAIYFNVVGPMTINSVTCFSDLGAPQIKIKRDVGGTLTDVATLTCSTSPSGATQAVSVPLNLNDKLDFDMFVADGTSRRVTVAIKATVN